VSRRLMVPMPRFRPVPGDCGEPSVRTQERSDGRVPGSDSARLLDIPAGRMVTVKEDKGSPAQEQEWLRQLSLIYGGLILIGVYMVQPFLTAASLDLSARICVVAFSVAIPLLAALVIVNRQELFRRRMTTSVLATIARVVAQDLASLAWSPASGTSTGSPGWDSWQAGSWQWGCTRQATGAWNGTRRRRPRKAKNPATPSHSLFEGERPVRLGCARPARLPVTTAITSPVKPTPEQLRIR
jgi:hypothetical protein